MIQAAPHCAVERAAARSAPCGDLLARRLPQVPWCCTAHPHPALPQAPNNVPASFDTFTFEEGALRVTFEAAGSTWALRFGSEAAYRRFCHPISN